LSKRNLAAKTREKAIAEVATLEEIMVASKASPILLIAFSAEKSVTKRVLTDLRQKLPPPLQEALLALGITHQAAA